MGKHLTIEEKKNAEVELRINREFIKLIKKYTKQIIAEIQKRNIRLENFLQNKKYSEHCGMYGMNGLCYKLYGKKADELNMREKREYEAVAKVLRERKKLEDK